MAVSDNPTVTFLCVVASIGLAGVHSYYVYLFFTYGWLNKVALTLNVLLVLVFAVYLAVAFVIVPSWHLVFFRLFAVMFFFLVRKDFYLERSVW